MSTISLRIYSSQNSAHWLYSFCEVAVTGSDRFSVLFTVLAYSLGPVKGGNRRGKHSCLVVAATRGRRRSLGPVSLLLFSNMGRRRFGLDFHVGWLLHLSCLRVPFTQTRLVGANRGCQGINSQNLSIVPTHSCSPRNPSLSAT